jgi:hypothetical protein
MNMDFEHFRLLVLGTLQRDLVEPGLYVNIAVTDDGPASDLLTGPIAPSDRKSA